MSSGEERYRQERARIEQGHTRYRDKLRAEGKLFVRDRLRLLLDDESTFSEDGLLANAMAGVFSFSWERMVVSYYPPDPKLEERGMLDVQMIIDGSGTASDRTDLDLELRDIRAHVLDRTVGATQRQAVVDLVDPGDYIAYVRDAGSGNRARFELRAALTPVAPP